MRILNCYMANDSKGHFVTAKEAAKNNRQDVLCCVSCGCPLTLKRGNDGQPPWFEHDQMTVAAKILLRYNLYFRTFSEPGRQRTLITAGKQDQGAVSIKIEY